MANATTNARTAVLFNGAANTVNQTRATLGTAGCFRLAKDHLLPSMAPNVFTAVAGEDYVRVEPRQMAYVTFDGLVFADALHDAGLHFVGKPARFSKLIPSS